MSVETTSPPAGGTTLSGTRLTSAHSELQAIDAEYYNITDAGGTPLAGLIVLMDRKSRPVRAELHIGDSSTESEREQALRQAYLLLRDRYRSSEGLRFYVLRSSLERESTTVELDGPAAPSPIPSWLRPVGLAAIVLLLAFAAGWFLNGMTNASPAAEQTSAPVPVSGSQVDAPAAVDAPASTEGSDTTEAASEATPFVRIFETNGLPNSNNARAMDLGQRARIQPGYSITVRTEPGADAGDVAGYLEGNAEMVLVNGPVWLQGLSDTIVWWYVRLDDGTEGWVPANTSELTLLEPVP